MSTEADLRALLLEHTRRRSAQDSGEPVEVRLREMLIAAFGEDDFAAAMALGVEQETAENNDK
jgi:hypothetical protein